MARSLSEFFSPKAISCKAYFAKYPKGPHKHVIEEVDLQEVKKGGDKVLALKLAIVGDWVNCNLTNANALAKTFGDDVDAWVGRKIVISSVVTQFQGQSGFAFKSA